MHQIPISLTIRTRHILRVTVIALLGLHFLTGCMSVRPARHERFDTPGYQIDVADDAADEDSTIRSAARPAAGGLPPSKTATGEVASELRTLSRAARSRAALAHAITLKPQLRAPLRLGVYFSPPPAGQSWKWSTDDSRAIGEWAEDYFSPSSVVESFVISDLVRRGDEIADLRIAAARQGADVLLVLGGDTTIRRYWNPLAVLYLTGIGYFIAPGSHADAVFSLKGALWDVGNEYLYLTVESSAEGDTFGPEGVMDDTVATAEAREESLEKLAPDLATRIDRAIAESRSAAASPRRERVRLTQE